MIGDFRTIGGAALALVLVASYCEAGTLLFQNRAAELGVDHRWGDNTIGGDLGGGVAIDDLDGDGDLDLILASKLPGTLVAFRQENGFFVDATAEFGLSNLPNMKQVLVVDLDNDGWRDLLLTGWGIPPALFRNVDGVFVNRTEGSGIEPLIVGLGTGASAADIDLDGDLDIYISYWKSGLPGPEAANALYRNDGGFTFTEIAAMEGVASEKKSYQPILTDLTNDGLPDLLVAQDKRGGLDFWRGDGAGSFENYTGESGLEGIESNLMTLIDGMGIAIGDFNGDLLPDVYVTNIQNGNVLYRASPSGRFDEVAIPSGTLMERIGWGTTFFDADNDGWQDLYVGNFEPPADALFQNQGDGSFRNVALAAGVARPRATLGLAVGDLDADGDIDVVTSHYAADSQLLMNESVDIGHWIQIELVGSTSNRDGVGAYVLVRAASVTQRRDRLVGISYLSSDSPWLHFGLDASESCELIEVHWPSGIVDAFQSVSADAQYRAYEGGDLVQLRAPNPPATESRLVVSGTNPQLIAISPLQLCLLSTRDGNAPTFQIYDSRGRLIHRLQSGDSGESGFCAQWDGVADNGESVASGIYRASVEWQGETFTTSFTLMR